MTSLSSLYLGKNSCFRSLFLLLFGINSSISHAQDFSQIGGDLTSDLPGRSAIQVNAPNVVDETRRVLQLSGFAVFHGLFDRNTGLGPLFVNASCKGCHIDNGRGPAKFSNSARTGSAMVVKVSRKGLKPNGSPRDVPGVGEQLQNHSIAGAPQVKVNLRWDLVDGRYPDGTAYTLRKPNLKFYIKGVSTRRLVSSLRMTPPVIGPGLLEAVAEGEILEFSDPTDANKDGISGRPNYVLDLISGEYAIGRFGFKASHITVEQQSAAALFNDIGISNPILFKTGEPIEFSTELLNQLTVYQKLAGIPRPINQDNSNVQAGKKLFQSVGCSSCHRMSMQTQEYKDPELSNQVFHPFTDLLLHDMGKGLADERAEFSAEGSEWRTTPLWGLGFSRRLAKRKAVFLHDGRARSIEEAILWHGGEAARSTRAFKKLPQSERADLLFFLDSL